LDTGLFMDVRSECATLRDVIVGTAEGYHRDPGRVEIVNGKHHRTLAAAGQPDTGRMQAEFAGFRSVLEAAGVRVHSPHLAPASVQDQTCPRDIGFVIGNTFVEAGMRVASRMEEIAGITHILDACIGPRVAVPPGICLEGGDVIVDGAHVFVGCGQRSDREGLDFLRARFGDTHEVVPLPCRSPDEGEDVLHLDCTFNPLGLGHALIYPDGLDGIPEVLSEKYDWIEVTREEADELATNVLSVAPDRIIARSAPSCARVNAALRTAGYRVEEVDFDAVPGTGGSFRCATLPLRRGPG